MSPTEDVIALWGWHDGDRIAHDDGEGRPSIFPDDGHFPSLAGALEQSSWLRRITMGGDDDGDCSVEHSDEGVREAELCFCRAHPIFSDEGCPLCLDRSDPTILDTPRAVHLTHDREPCPRLILAEAVRQQVSGCVVILVGWAGGTGSGLGG